MSVDIDSYLQEISADKPCGEDLEYDAEFIALEQDIKGKPEVQIGDTFQEAEAPIWRDIIKSCENLLGRTRDLRVLVNYFRALAAIEGFSGVYKSLALINGLTETRWATLYPLLDPDDDNDPTERINILMTLCDFETTLKPLQKIPLIDSRALGSFSLRDVHIAEGKIMPVSGNDEDQPSLSNIEGAVQDCDIKQLQQTAKFVSDSLENLDNLEKFITEQVGIVDAPSFTELRLLLKEMTTITAGWLETRGVDESVDDDESTVEGDEQGEESNAEGTPAPAKKIPAGINSSQDVIKALNKICEYYHKNEPSSPIPLLLTRVVGLVGKDFMDVLKDIAPNGVEQFEFLSGSADKEQ
ncbi:MAG: type VI secretion system protein TssA [Methylococcaceae bacterium]|nr:type VI secretion system protein TssA [Methylococcaceae bacterium]